VFRVISLLSYIVTDKIKGKIL